MNTVIAVHAGLATAVMLFNALLSAWAMLKFFRGERGIDGNFAGALALSPVLGLIQAVTGVVLISLGLGGAPRMVHYLYGALVILGIPATFAFTRGRDDRGMLLIYAMILLFVCICGYRAYSAVYSGTI